MKLSNLFEDTTTIATKYKEKISKNHKIFTMWQLEDKLKKEGLLPKGLSISFFCPVYFAGQKKVEALLNKMDEHGELILFSLPSIEDPNRIKVGLNEMKRLGIKNPQSHLKKLKNGNLALRTYSELPGIEGVGNDDQFYEFVAYEAVQLGAFQIVPTQWLNAGDPYNQSYKFPGEKGYSPYWRVPPFDEFKKMRPDLVKGFKETNDGIIKTNFNTGM